jgi:hypothetical protein
VVPARRPSAYLSALLASPLVVLGLVGWTRFELARLPPQFEPGPTLGAEARAVLAIERIWTEYDVEQGAAAGTLEGLCAWLDSRGLSPGRPVAVEDDNLIEDGLEPLFVERVDRDSGVELTFSRALPGLDASDELTPLAAWAVTPRTWAGSGHVLLGRDLGCAICHVTVSAAPTDGARTREPVRVAVLGDLELRSDARVAVHGTLHLAGALLGAYEPLAPQGCERLRFAALGADLLPEADVGTLPDVAPLEALDLMRLRAAERLLLGRCRTGPRVLRRALPERFPTFDDVSPALDTATGPASGHAPGLTGGLTGGRGGVVSQGDRLAERDAGAPLAPTRRVTGHLWAVGTAAEPLHLDGDVELDGDLVLGGVVQGRGSLRARGMVIVVGSLRVDGQLALVAGTDLLAGAPVEGGSLARFVREARRSPLDLPSWISAERLGRMGERAEGALVLEAFCYAPRHVIVVSPRGGAHGDVLVRGGLVADVVAVHAPGELTLEDDPETRALLALRAPTGLELRALPRPPTLP